MQYDSSYVKERDKQGIRSLWSAVGLVLILDEFHELVKKVSSDNQNLHQRMEDA